MLVDNTPWESYIIRDAWPVWVKREDLCCGDDPNSPSFSKMRGVEAHLASLEDDGYYPPIGVLDTYHSKAGRGVAWMCQKMDIKCHVYYPVYKSEVSATDILPYNTEYEMLIHWHTIREHQLVAQQLGAHLHPLKAGRSSILYHQAKKHFAELTGGTGYMMPNALKLKESVDATAKEVWEWTPPELWGGTWVISISSGTIAAGVIKGLYVRTSILPQQPKIIAHLGYARSEASARAYMVDMAGVDPGDHLVLVNEGYQYKDKVDNRDIPWPCNQYYDAKAWKWLSEHIQELEHPIIFYNIGA